MDELIKSYKKKLYHKEWDKITPEERQANTDYHKNLRHNATPEQKASKKLTLAKYHMKKKLRKAAVDCARMGFDTQPFDLETYDN
jgi:DNA replication protein DnaC